MSPSAALLPLVALLAPAAPSGQGVAEPAAPKAQVVLALEITCTNRGEAGKSNAAPQVIGTPKLSTLDGATGSIQVTGGDIAYSLSLSPSLERENRAALLWNWQLSGKGLPGATSAALSGASRVVLGKEEPVAELTLRDPKTGQATTFHLRATTTVTAAAGGK